MFGPAAASIDEFLDAAEADIAVELTTLNPATGEPAISHIRAAFARRMHVVSANKGPIAHAYADLRDTAARQGVQFRFESAVMDGAPVFNLVRYNLPGVAVLGFTGALNSTSKLVIETMERGGSFEDGLALARKLGVTEADSSFDVEGWDSAAKTAALANVLMNARTTPQAVSTRGITRLTPQRMAELSRAGKTVRLISRARRGAGGITLRVRAEVLDKADILACTAGDFERAAAAHRPDGNDRDGIDFAGRGPDGVWGVCGSGGCGRSHAPRRRQVNRVQQELKRPKRLAPELRAEREQHHMPAPKRASTSAALPSTSFSPLM